MNINWVSTGDLAEKDATTAKVGNYDLFVFPPGNHYHLRAKDPPHWTVQRCDGEKGPRGTGPCESLAEGQARAVAWLEQHGTYGSIGTVTKANHRPCNCPGKGVEGGWHATWCAAKQVEIAIGAAPTAQVINDLERARRAFGDCAMVRDLEAKVRTCTCDTKDGKHANTCGVLGNIADAMCPPLAPKQWDRLIEDRAFVPNGWAAMVAEHAARKPEPASLEWLARDLGLSPNAPDETIKATVKKRLAGQWEELVECTRRNGELVDRADAAQRTREEVIQDLAAEQKENDTLRGMVAETQIEIAKLRRGKR
ncbi:MAG: hypothetical protein WDA27_14300 [Actinomycetota bacterium]